MNVNAASDSRQKKYCPDAVLLEKSSCVWRKTRHNMPPSAIFRRSSCWTDACARPWLSGRPCRQSGRLGVERLERLVWLGLAEGDGQGYRKMGGTRQ